MNLLVFNHKLYFLHSPLCYLVNHRFSLIIITKFINLKSYCRVSIFSNHNSCEELITYYKMYALLFEDIHNQEK